ncbi:MAG TPA: sugar transferase [Gemmatimonadales bacterium]|jgi:lipopolysaccharide/colanic/teichoic acid biosynthesis glycosyltransferase|nr:sugar transferase [Gemmatimonadales bacterium]
MVKRLFDVVCATVALVVTAPLIAIAAIGIKLSDRGPVFYRARRVGYLGREFTMFKLRTMKHEEDGDAGGAVITGHGDERITTIGRFLRRSKIDELPQLFNVLRGDMAIVGPRPEDPAIVLEHYSTGDLETLGVRPGLASPGSIYQFTSGDKLLTGNDPEARYVDKLLKTKLALDRVYLRRASMRRDMEIIGRTLWAIGAVAAGRRKFAPPPEMTAARRLLEQDGV